MTSASVSHPEDPPECLQVVFYMRDVHCNALYAILHIPHLHHDLRRSSQDVVSRSLYMISISDSLDLWIHEVSDVTMIQSRRMHMLCNALCLCCCVGGPLRSGGCALLRIAISIRESCAVLSNSHVDGSGILGSSIS